MIAVPSAVLPRPERVEVNGRLALRCELGAGRFVVVYLDDLRRRRATFEKDLQFWKKVVDTYLSR